MRYFPVQTGPVDLTAGSREELGSSVQALSILEQVGLQLSQKLSTSDPAASSHPGPRHFSQASPWLDTTQWARYLRGHDLQRAACLIEIPSPPAVQQAVSEQQDGQSEHDLLLLLDSFDRVIEQARRSLLEDRVNVFDQHRINSFVPRRSHGKPLWHKLQEPTYKMYKKVWKQLLCFLYRLVWKRQAPVLHCRLTAAQSTALDAALRAAADLAQATSESGNTDPDQYREIDRACLLLCIALLDHALHGDIYDSVVVGFLAVLGISPAGTYHKATAYTPFLSAFVKLAQLLVVQRAVLAVEEDEVDYPSELLDAMQARFMAFDTRSPMNWVLKIRAYGKKVQDSSTALGNIIWSDDDEELKYKGLTLTMTALRQFIASQVKTCQDQLHALFLINPEEERINVVPVLALRAFEDDATINTPGWSFLQDPRNVALHGHERWLLNRVASTDWLQEEFFMPSRTGKTARWSRRAAEHYLQQVDAFLHRLLLIIHITSGQPSRGTELLSIQYCNTAHGLQRNVFVENGLVSFVTSYHKGYSIQGSTKIIHRYLPKEVSELVVYYLWLVLPFTNQLRLLALDQAAAVTTNPFLWALIQEKENESGQYGPWPSSRLGHIIKREFQAQLSTQASTPIWRHVAIAINRRHLQQAKFKKDYNMDSRTWNDEQAAHPTSIAGAIYARGIEEAAGHVEAARTEYRRISRAWHSWLGFALYLGGRTGACKPSSSGLKSSSSSLGLTLKRKALADLSLNRGGKRRGKAYPQNEIELGA